MTFDELKGMVLVAARENRDAIEEEDGIAESTAESFAWFDLLAAVGAIRIINRGDNLMGYVWTLDPDPRREADERLWAVAIPQMRDVDPIQAWHALFAAITDHREAIQAINAGKPA